MQTQVITYNLRERGRKFRGQERNFNIPAIVQAINSPETQERIKNRDMLGYYGHWSRVKYGLEPREGGLEKGKPFYVEPAIVTIHLKAFPDGTIEHQEEFLDTDSGKAAAKLYLSRVGGFSSAINTGPIPSFHGFDYVFEPNYTTNRGYKLVMDSVNSEEELLDKVKAMPLADIDAEIQSEQVRGLLMLLDSVQTLNQRANETIENLRAENDSLMLLVEKAGKEKKAILDAIEPQFISARATQRLKNDIAGFHAAKKLPAFDSASDDGKFEDDMNRDIPVYSRLTNKLFR